MHSHAYSCIFSESIIWWQSSGLEYVQNDRIKPEKLENLMCKCDGHVRRMKRKNLWRILPEDLSLPVPTTQSYTWDDQQSGSTWKSVKNPGRFAKDGKTFVAVETVYVVLWWDTGRWCFNNIAVHTVFRHKRQWGWPAQHWGWSVEPLFSLVCYGIHCTMAISYRNDTTLDLGLYSRNSKSKRTIYWSNNFKQSFAE
jgi:hypothetical protein